MKVIATLKKLPVVAFTLPFLLSSPSLVKAQACRIQQAPFTESFDSPSKGWKTGVSFDNRYNKINDCWSRTPDPTVLAGGYDNYNWGTRSGATYNSNTGPASDHTRNDTSDQYIYAPGPIYRSHDTAFITSPSVDLSSISNPRAGFWYFMYGEDVGQLLFQVSTNSGRTWRTLQTIQGQKQVSATAPWREKLVDLSAYANDTIQVRFAATGSRYYGDIAIDDLKLEATPSCVKPTNVQLSSISDSSATVSWTP